MKAEERFRQALADLSCQLVQAADGKEAAAAVLHALRQRRVTEVVAWAEPWLSELGLPQAARQAGISWYAPPAGTDSAEVREAAARAGAGVTGADWGVAETGTLALLSGPGRPRMTHLLPPLHIALLSRTRLLPDMAALFREMAALARLGATPSALQLVTGPSRSADIADVLVRKVHGPGEVMVVLVG